MLENWTQIKIGQLRIHIYMYHFGLEMRDKDLCRDAKRKLSSVFMSIDIYQYHIVPYIVFRPRFKEKHMIIIILFNDLD